MESFKWKQVGGDVDPGAHGGTIAMCDGDTLTIIQIQPVVAYVGRREAAAVGFPFWTKRAEFAADELVPEDHAGALSSLGITPAECTPLAVALARVDHGDGDEGDCGWARDVIPPPMRVQWFVAKRPQGWRYLADADREFRALSRECPFGD